jgi:hypothetical protein
VLMCIGSLDNWFGFSLIEMGCAVDALSHNIWIVWFGVSRVRVASICHARGMLCDCSNVRMFALRRSVLLSILSFFLRFFAALDYAKSWVVCWDIHHLDCEPSIHRWALCLC